MSMKTSIHAHEGLLFCLVLLSLGILRVLQALGYGVLGFRV